jgi:2-polyprenyl-3-methyl-5-hydroxy-6-metoxy-1,4-benzoquinol methylase
VSEPLREEDIRPARLMADKASAVEADKRFLLNRRDRWVEVPCPACGAGEGTEFGRKEGWVYRDCVACRTIYASPRPSAELLGEFYACSENYAYWNAHVFPATEEARRKSMFRPRAERTIEYCRRHGVRTGTLLEVGAAFGTFCTEVRDRGVFEQVVALEPTPDLAETCRARGFEVIEQPMESVEREAFADVLAAFEVIEHVFDPALFVETCRRLLRPGGLLVLSCPNGRGFDNAVLGVRSGTFDHEHLNYFHPASLAALVARCGCEVVEVETPGKLDVDLVSKAVERGDVDLSAQPFLAELFMHGTEEARAAFQDFLAANGLSGHMWIAALRGA